VRLLIYRLSSVTSSRIFLKCHAYGGVHVHICMFVGPFGSASYFPTSRGMFKFLSSIFPGHLGCTALFVAIRNQLSLPHVLSASLFFYLAATKVAPAQRSRQRLGQLLERATLAITQPFLGRVALAEADGMAPPVYNQAGSSCRNSSSSLPSRVCLPSSRLFYLSVLEASRAASTLSFFRIFWDSPISESQRHRLVSEGSEV